MKKLMLGNEAIARGAFEAGVTVATAYPGTPSTEVTEFIAKYDEIYSEWSPNEKVALEVAIGSAFAGARSICTMKHVGLNVAADPLFTSSYTGINAGLVIVVADDPGMHSSQNEQDTRLYAKASKIPLLEPADSQECKEYVIKAFEISEKYDTPVIVRLTTRIAHSQSIVTTKDRKDVPLRDYKKDFPKFVMMPAMARKRHVEVIKRNRKIFDELKTLKLNKTLMNDTEIGIITAGVTFQYAREVFPNASFLKLGILFPFDIEACKEFSKKIKKLIIIEELEPYIEEEIQKLNIKFTGKDKLPLNGEYSTNLLREKLLGAKIKHIGADEELSIRPPVMCPGCPHRATFYVLKKLKLTVTGDIGCYTLGALPPNESMDTCVCMGASVSMAHGFEKARGKDFGKKTIAVLGDSTFIHSGITGLIDIVYNKGNSNVLILDNRITGMTGHQENPATGKTIKGEETVEVDFIKLANAVGIKKAVIADPFDIRKFEKIVKDAVNSEEPTVIVAKRECALLKNVKFEGIMQINNEKCKYCKLCLKIGCPAISDNNGTISINDSLCVGCGLCRRLCSFSAINLKEGGS
jgi:indolepyruvate ferredoxin oxidoreductase alpha subunit